MLAAKRLLQKAIHHQGKVGRGSLKPEDLDLQVSIHYGIPSTSSLLAFDPVQRLLAAGTLDGRIKVFGGDGIEGLVISPKSLPFKYLEFFQNRGFLVSITNENDIQVWNLEDRCLACCLQWESNITAFSVISGSYLMYLGDESGMVSVVKFDADDPKLLQLPYQLPESSLKEAAEFPSPERQPVIGILPQSCPSQNRLLIAYQNGLIILWDISEARVLFVGGGKDLQLKGGISNPQSSADTNDEDNISYHLQEKEISALCWASSNGSILAVGYIDGDILLWKLSTAPSSKNQQSEVSNNIVRLQLSSAKKRLPVIVLHWSKCSRSNNCDGQLFIYGGDEIGSEEVLTVLTLEWSSKLDTLKCTGRLDLTLTGSFADMILLPSSGSVASTHQTDLLTLTNPGQLHLYSGPSLYALLSKQEKETPVVAAKFPAVVPLSDPSITAARFIALPRDGNLSKVLSEVGTVKKQGASPVLIDGTKWPLTGGVPSQFSFGANTVVERVYIAGYEDGCVRLWNATYPVLSPICVLEVKAQDVQISSLSDPVSKFDLCSITSTLAVGNACGVVRIYKLKGSTRETSFLYVTETKNEVRSLPEGGELQYTAVFSLLNSPIHAIHFTNSGAKLAVGFECSRVAMIDMNSLSVLFLTDCMSASTSPIISVTGVERSKIHSIERRPEEVKPDTPANSTEEIMFVLTKDATLNVIDSGSGRSINAHPWRPKKKANVVSMYVIDSSSPSSGRSDDDKLEESGQDTVGKNVPIDKPNQTRISSHNNNKQNSSDIETTAERLTDSLILLCCEDSLRLYSTKNTIQGNSKSIYKVKHTVLCCWASTFNKDNKVCGVILLFQTGVIEIRSLPDLELLKESSLMSVLRWNFKANLEKIMSSDDGHITMANGCELAFISLLSGEKCFRIPESYPCLHDKVLAAAADAAFSLSSNQKKSQVSKSGIISGIVKGFKREKVDVNDILNPQSDVTHLEQIFSKPPFSDLSHTVTDHQEVAELNIDDINIDEPPLHPATTSQDAQSTKKDK
ncbi:hypothetical protein K2173_008485 [Erythroxylum novogranatense]|uniref:Uncharacterized protein n=1 Tax=Erythroxylum novogranatense TaxID=1862640 RepID=A0AAV8U967_9ROSI|nr:hypothetical protein K2173_008485 [Erythroxylum novogranatense]